MSTSSGQFGLLARAIDGPVIPHGSVRAQDRKGSTTVAYPKASDVGLEQGDELKRYVHVETGAAIFLPPGVEAGDVLAQE
jgi:hypothetical protein